MPEAGDEVRVVLKNRDRFDGEFVKDLPTQYVVRIERVEVRIDKSTVERLVVLDAPQVRYQQMRAVIADDDVPRLIMLAQWLSDHDLYVLALKELDQLLARAPNSAEASRLRRVIQERWDLVSRPAGEAEGNSLGGARERESVDEAVASKMPFPLLTDEQINLMRVFEIDLNDPPKMVVPRDTIERLLQEYANDPLIPTTREGREAFFRKSPAQILDTMFRVRARELYGRVEVLEDPPSMQSFRDNIHAAWLINSCATMRCHGGGGAGDLWLTNRRATSAQSVYTNYLILDRFKTTEGEPLIDFEQPERSVLLHMGLARDDAITPHPAVPGWTPVLRSRDGRRFRQAVEWIRSMYRPRPEYPIDYAPPLHQVESEAVER